MRWECRTNNTKRFSNKITCSKNNKCSKTLILCKLNNWLNNSFHNNQFETFSPKELWEEIWLHQFWIQIHSSNNQQIRMLIVCLMFLIIVSWEVNQPILIRINVKSCVKWSLALSSNPKHNHLITSWKCKKKIYKIIIEIWKLQITLRKMRILDSKLNSNKFRKNLIIEIKS